MLVSFVVVVVGLSLINFSAFSREQMAIAFFLWLKYSILTFLLLVFFLHSVRLLVLCGWDFHWNEKDLTRCQPSYFRLMRFHLNSFNFSMNEHFFYVFVLFLHKFTIVKVTYQEKWEESISYHMLFTSSATSSSSFLFFFFFFCIYDGISTNKRICKIGFLFHNFTCCCNSRYRSNRWYSHWNNSVILILLWLLRCIIKLNFQNEIWWTCPVDSGATKRERKKE